MCCKAMGRHGQAQRLAVPRIYKHFRQAAPGQNRAGRKSFSLICGAQAAAVEVGQAAVELMQGRAAVAVLGRRLGF